MYKGTADDMVGPGSYE